MKLCKRCEFLTSLETITDKWHGFACRGHSLNLFQSLIYLTNVMSILGLVVQGRQNA